MNRRTILLTGVAVVVVVIVAGVLYSLHFASSVSQSHAAAGAITVTPTATTSSAIATTSSTATTTTGGSMRTYQIVPAQTTASYSVYENLIFEDKPNNDAIGTTHSVKGSFQAQNGSSPALTAMDITIDLSTLQSDSDRRDSYVRQNTLQTDTYPDATFVSVSTQGLPASYTDGEDIHFQIIGNLTMHGKTNKATFDVQGKLSGDTITGTATSTVYMTDYGITPPNLANIVVAQNKVLITLKFTAKAS